MPRPTPKSPVSAKDFVGAQMSNFLFSLASQNFLPHEVRKTARELQEKWDSVSTFRLNNPIVAAELEARFKSGVSDEPTTKDDARSSG